MQIKNTKFIVILVPLLLFAGLIYAISLRSNNTNNTSSPQSNTIDPLSEEQSNVTTIELEAGNFYFRPAQIVVNAGTVKVRVTNSGGFHDFVIDELDIRQPMEDGTEFEFTVKPGTYTFYCSVGNHRQMGMEGTIVVQDANTPINIQTKQGWKSYKDESLGISFSVPEKFEITTNGKNSFMAGPMETTPSAIKTSFVYISVIPTGYPEQSSDIYNYNSEIHKKLTRIPVGQIRSVSDNTQQDDWYMYERKSNVNINGRNAMVYVNQKPREFPDGTIEYRYIFATSDNTIIFGGYIDNNSVNSELNQDIFNTILNTVVIR